MATVADANATMDDAPKDEQTFEPFFAAASRGDADECESLMAKDGAAKLVAAEDAAGRTALSLAAARGHTKVVKSLLDAGATNDAVCAGWTASHHAAFGGHAEVCTMVDSTRTRS